jgi:hypothetical protein
LDSGVAIISAGGKVSSSQVFIGGLNPLPMEVRVTGAGSTLTATTSLSVGDSDFMSISQGGRVDGGSVATILPSGRVAIGVGGEPGTLETGSLVLNGALTFNHTGTTTLAPPLSGTGEVIKNGLGASTIVNASGFTGKMTVNTGELILKNSLGAAEFNANSGGTLRFDAATVNPGEKAIRANAGGVVEFTNSSVNGGFLRGPGTHLLKEGPANSFRGVTTYNSTNIVQNGTATFTNFTNGGSLVNNANSTLELDGAVNASSGVITVNHSLLTRDFTNNGVLNVRGGATHDNVTTMVAGGGSRTTIDAGGMVFVSDDASLELNGGLLVNRGTINGTVNVNFGSLATGDGVFSGAVNVNQGGRFSPGNSPGSATVGALTLNAGGSFAFEINDAAGAPGTGFDFIRDLGALNIAAGSTQNARFAIEVVSLDGTNNPGLALNFDPSQASSFRMISAEGGIQGFDPALFFVDTSGFRNDLAGGTFSVVEAGNDLLLTFSPVPEPSTTALLLASSSLFLRRRRSTPRS